MALKIQFWVFHHFITTPITSFIHNTSQKIKCLSSNFTFYEYAIILNFTTESLSEKYINIFTKYI